MPSMILPIRTAFVLSWTLKDSAGASINNADVVATLFSGRSLLDPEGVPGTPLAPINALTLAYVTASAGVYSAAVPATLDPPFNGLGYVLVIDGSVSATPIYHAEQRVVINSGSLDLTTLEQVKAWIGTSKDLDDETIQDCITAFSLDFLRRTGRGAMNGDIPAKSPFNTTVDYIETYDGQGGVRQFLRNWPINSVASVTANGIAVPASPSFSSPGYVIDGSGKSISIRCSGPSYRGAMGGYRGAYAPYCFYPGIQNVVIAYNAGFAVEPYDIEMCVRKVVGQNYKRRNWIDQRSQAMANGAGTLSFRDWEIPPECERVIQYYRRIAAV